MQYYCQSFVTQNKKKSVGNLINNKLHNRYKHTNVIIVIIQSYDDNNNNNNDDVSVNIFSKMICFNNLQRQYR